MNWGSPNTKLFCSRLVAYPGFCFWARHWPCLWQQYIRSWHQIALIALISALALVADSIGLKNYELKIICYHDIYAWSNSKTCSGSMRSTMWTKSPRNSHWWAVVPYPQLTKSRAWLHTHAMHSLDVHPLPHHWSVAPHSEISKNSPKIAVRESVRPGCRRPWCLQRQREIHQCRFPPFPQSKIRDDESNVKIHANPKYIDLHVLGISLLTWDNSCMPFPF